MFHQILRTLLLLLVGVPAVAQTALPTAWNFSTPPVTSPPNGWTLGLGTNGNLTYAFGVSDALSCRLDLTGEFVQINFADSPGKLSYYLSPQNAGNPWGGQFDIQESTNGTQWNTVRSITSKPSTSTNFTNSKYTDNLSPQSRFVRFYFTNKLPGGQPTPGGNMALDSILLLPAPQGQSAAIVIKRNGSAVVNGTTSVIGNASSSVFSVENQGTVQALSIDSVKIEGDAASDFSVTGLSGSIGPNASQNFTIGFNPTSNGSRVCTLKVFNNDPNKNPYTVRLYGIGGTLATEPLSSAGAISVSNVTSYSCRLGFSVGSSPSEKYILLRKRGNAFTEVPQDGVTYQRGDNIGTAQVAYVGDSVLSNYRPNYLFSNSEYTFKVFPFNGPSGFENYLTTNSSTGSVQTPGKQPGNYYEGLDPLQTSFVTDLRNKINPHDTIFYSLYASRMVSSWLERDTVQGQKVVNCIYTNIPYIYNGSFAWWSGSGGNTATLTREHSFPQSWMPSNTGANWPTAPNGKEYPEYNDMHHLYPAHQQNANARRGNNPYGVVVNATYTSPTGMGKLGTNAGGQTVYEPRDEHKGDAARALMYMAACYNKATPAQLNWSFPTNQSPALILQWHQQDPPSDFEIARHELVAQYQKNRNPFIDHPEWASYINFATMGYVVANQPLEFHNGLATWPNPSQDKIFVDASLYFTPSMSYEWLDVTGKLLKQGQLEAAITQVELPADKGVYFLRIQTPNGARMTRVVKN